ncbi:hypothetical protein PUN28_010684 [Cardiocondyla obscurior]|uniref:Uncharacterized protein n=1 Tax=Cardiocondyla obscurior TaxID=286306 RepID=A0AAW2FLR4_9HYME
MLFILLEETMRAFHFFPTGMSGWCSFDENLSLHFHLKPKKYTRRSRPSSLFTIRIFAYTTSAREYARSLSSCLFRIKLVDFSRITIARMLIRCFLCD